MRSWTSLCKISTSKRLTRTWPIEGISFVLFILFYFILTYKIRSLCYILSWSDKEASPSPRLSFFFNKQLYPDINKEYVFCFVFWLFVYKFVINANIVQDLSSPWWLLNMTADITTLRESIPSRSPGWSALTHLLMANSSWLQPINLPILESHCQ